MISTKYSLFMVAAFVAGASIFASPVPQAIAAVIATDVQCTGCVGASDLASSAVTTTKLASNSVNGGKISDGTISAADLGPDSVGASEIKGVSKLLFGQCSPSDAVGLPALEGGFIQTRCTVSGADTDDSVLATLNGDDSFCFDAGRAFVESNNVVVVWLRDHCETTDPITYGAGNSLTVLVYDK